MAFKNRAFTVLAAALLTSSTSIVIAADNSSALLELAEHEVQRTMDGLADEKHAPYFCSYSIAETEAYTATASFGEIVQAWPDHTRTLDIDIRVGDYNLDNTHQLRGSSFQTGGSTRGIELPVGDDLTGVQHALWKETDAQYKNAVERYLKVLTNTSVKVEEDDTSDDFSREKPETYTEQISALNIDTAEWNARLRTVSARFNQHPWILQGLVFMRAEVLNKYFVSSEGARIQTSERYIRVFVQGKTKASDGMSLPLFRSYFAFDANNLPTEQQMIREADELIGLLDELRKAPLIETYSGPAILSGEAAGVFFHEIFGHRIEGHRQKDVNSSQTFKNLLGESILPDFIDVVFDPTIDELNNQDVVGFFKYDDQGVRAQKVQTVEDGVFTNFLMSRSPINRFPQSNGHGRRQPGYPVVSRQSNLLVQSEVAVTFDELKEELRELCEEQDKEYGLYFVEIQGGFTFTQRTIPNAFNVQPLLVYKIFADGRPDELVRGVDLIGTPLTTFGNIVSAADDLGIFNGMCGAESGSVPVSASSPSLLISTIEVQKKAKSQARPPILPAPGTQSN